MAKATLELQIRLDQHKSAAKKSGDNMLQRDIKFAHLILTNRKITVRKIAEELSVSTRTVYRMIKAASPTIHLDLKNGIITRLT